MEEKEIQLQTGMRLFSPYISDTMSPYLKNGQSLLSAMDVVCHVMTICDTKGWGSNSRDAAKVAAETFVKYFKSRRSDITSTRKAAKMCLRAFFMCNAEIIKGLSADTIFNAGLFTPVDLVTYKVLPQYWEEL